MTALLGYLELPNTYCVLFQSNLHNLLMVYSISVKLLLFSNWICNRILKVTGQYPGKLFIGMCELFKNWSLSEVMLLDKTYDV